MFKYIIFDFDGTLADSKDVFIATWNLLAKKHKFKEIKHDELEMLRKLSIHERSKRLNFPMYKIPLIIPKLYRSYRQFAMDIKLFPGIKDMLDGLEKEGYKIAIISSNTEDVIRKVLQRNAVESVSEILCSNRIFGKDQLIRRLLKKHHIDSSNVVYVGDEQRDIIACKKVGVKVIWVSWGYDAKELAELEKPDYLVDTPKEILEIVSKHS